MVKINMEDGISVNGKNYKKGKEGHEFSSAKTVHSVALQDCTFDEFPVGLLEHTDTTTLSFNKCKFKDGTLPDAIDTFKGLTNLSLTECGLREFPSVITSLPAIRELYLGNGRKCPNQLKNSFQSIPQSVTNLTELEYLDLSWCRLEKCPSALSKITTLETLNLRGNFYIESLACLKFDNLRKLENLDVAYCGLTQCPDFPSGCDGLKRLDMGLNNIRSLNNTISNLTNLRHLDVSICELNEFPEAIALVTTLVHLNISGNNIQELPASIAKLTKLQHLDASKCNLTKCPKSIGSLKSLAHLNLSDNDIAELPEWFVELKHLEVLLIVN